ncbi:hypothetical protein [Bradyrhizobium cenepequi]|uniref:hypothetical protein n=1 Tax=Bradyrhizobium cenepequi TaxID=2821403 RepID=UPI001CE314CB|nr:hypothetical protein [Bradyrhizobium cenepequi]MCA6108359.1 hypothetical protein [Bradyrhizobium cenepequi]
MLRRRPCPLGEAPQAPADESCDVRDFLALAAAAQDDDFEAMRGVLGTAAKSSEAVRNATEEFASPPRLPTGASDVDRVVAVGNIDHPGSNEGILAEEILLHRGPRLGESFGDLDCLPGLAM